MKNLSTVIFFLITICNQKVLSRRLQNTIDDKLYFVKPYSLSNGAAPPYQAWRHADYDAYSDEHEHDHRIIFPDVDWSDAIPNWTAQRKIQQCATSCQPNSAYPYQPVCGTNGVTYHNLEHMECFMRCGVDVNIRQMSPCPGWSGTTARPTQQPQTTAATPTSTFNIQQACMSSCPTTPEYNPVCGSDNITYENHGKLLCAQWCGKDVQEVRRSPCPKMKSTVEPVTTNTTPRSTFSGSSNKVRRCMAHCPTDPQYNPVCGTNMETFYNLSRLQCAINCGVDVSLLKSVACHIEVRSEDDEDFDINERYKDS